MALAVVPNQPELHDERAERLEARVAELCGVANVAAAALVDAVAEVIAAEAWAGGGYRSIEHWVGLHCGLSSSRARQLVAAARRVNDLPVCAEAFRAGRLSLDQAAVIFVRTPANRDAEVAGVAPYATVGQLRRMVEALPPLPPPPRDTDPDCDADVDAESASVAGNDEIREVSAYYTDRNTFVLRSEMPADLGAVVERALRAARTDLTDAKLEGVDSVDALLRVMNAALDSFDPEAARSGRASDRYQVMVHVDARTGATQPHLGVWLPDTLARYITCDATMRLAIHQAFDDGADRLLGISPAARVVDAKLRAAIEHRDRGCRVPGCEHTRWLHIHHIRHHHHGGLTIPSNLIALCPYHHRLHHQGLLGIDGDPEKPDGITFTNQWGQPIRPSPPQPPPAGTPPADAARAAALPHPQWEHPPGEHLDARYFAWATEPD